MEDLIGQIEVDVLPSQRGDVYQMLCKVLANIAEKPSEPKYRTLKKDNKKVAETLLRHPAAVCILMAAGFEDQGETLHCPESADLAPVREAVELLQCIVASMESEDQPAQAPAAPVPQQPGAAPAGVPRPTAATMKAEMNPKNFARRKDEEKERQQAAEQLAALRASRAQAPPPEAGMTAASPTSQAQAEAKKPVKSAFDFENRRAKEEQRQQATESLEDLRKRQKEKFAEFQADPNARNAEVYRQPASVAGNGKAEQSWGDWFGGMFGGGSSGSGGGGGGSGGSRQSNDRPGPRVKGIGDLPKPVQRG